ncbi:carbohydrate-binding domain-containing protein [Candidatus Arthromitus sp. SFB-rat-Yit]|uniref:carbohydrate-binding domain-containing protein n=1 Tax=Candidatus Arthromitus sp. SFB-rat-Yit TaxID=1041504 RepID=UPI000227A36A|nr:carbohydrate-binding domain-containing protein [Candidatus Arthromitus sp. SFB-rat-Yit]BAK80863.1 putative lipoprotein [Candidatus Arthromitus sp. SFB-rat-Yit]
MKKSKLLQAVISGIILFSFSGCGTTNTSASLNASQNVSNENNNSSVNLSTSSNSSTGLTQSVIKKELNVKDYEVDYDENLSTKINLSDGQINYSGTGVLVNDKTVTINKAGTYVLSGNMENAQIIVDVNKTDDVRIILNGINIHNETSAAIYVKSADKLIMTLKEGTTNILSGGANYVNIDDNNIDGVIFSKDDLTINGNGELKVTSNYKHAIVSKNDLNIVSGTFNIISQDQGLSGKDSVRIYGGIFNIKSNGQGIRCKNTEELEKGNIYIAGGNFEIESVQDAINATGSVVVDDGNFNIKTDDDGIRADVEAIINSGDINILKSYEGIEGYRVIINGGNINITSSDDGINASNPNVTRSETMDRHNFTTNNNAPKPPDVNNDTNVDNTPTNHPNNTTFNADNVPAPPPEGDNNGFSGNNRLQQPPNGGMMGGRGGMIADENVYITINGGNLVIDASGDGIDSNGNITINDGNILVSSNPGNGENAIDYDGNITVNGGILIGVGGTPMNQNINENTKQPVISYTAPSGNENEVKLVNSNGDEVVSWKAPKSYSSVLITHPNLNLNNKYTLISGGSSTEITLENVLTTNITRGNGGRGQRPRSDGFDNQTVAQ